LSVSIYVPLRKNKTKQNKTKQKGDFTFRREADTKNYTLTLERKKKLVSLSWTPQPTHTKVFLQVK